MLHPPNHCRQQNEEGAAAAPAAAQHGPQSFTYAYCHGFLSGPGSVKGQVLRESMLEAGVDMMLLNLNGADNDPGAITCSGALQAVRDFHLEKKATAGDPGLKLRLVGSSLGGYVVARFVRASTAEKAKCLVCRIVSNVQTYS